MVADVPCVGKVVDSGGNAGQPVLLAGGVGAVAVLVGLDVAALVAKVTSASAV
jgi:hypothetical protein